MKECVVALCGNDGKLVPICANGHMMHLECLKGWVRNREKPSCPSCRDPYLSEMKDFFRDNPYVHQPPSPGPTPNPLEFGAPAPQVMDQLLAHAYMYNRQHHPSRTVTTSRTVRTVLNGNPATWGNPPAPPPLMRPQPFRRRPQYFVPPQQDRV